MAGAAVLYRTFLKEAKGFASINVRGYALRRIRAGFVQSKGVTNPEEVSALRAKAEVDLAALRRQVMVSKLYPA